MKTKKIMYNDCFGGFGISGFAKVEYAKRVLHEPFKVYRDEYSDKELTEAEIAELSEEPNLHSIHIIKNNGEEFKFPNWWADQLSRQDPILLSLLEEHGSRKISAYGSDIQIEELDETDLWKIIEVEDGFEEVRTLDLNGWYN